MEDDLNLINNIKTYTIKSKEKENLDNIKYEASINNISNPQSEIYSNKKINELKKIIKSINKNNSCSIHSLPLNIICIDERKKICSQCALNDTHSNHQIITDKDFIINIEQLYSLLQDIDNNQIKYLSNNNEFNVKNIIDNINCNINQLIELTEKTKEKIINNINLQCEKILNFLNKRKNEIEKKYKNNNFDMNNLRESALNWIHSVNYKLSQINEINEQNVDFIKLIDDEKDKNISNLIRAGKQLKDRFIFAQDSFKIIKYLDEFKNSGIKIEPNFKIINNILDNKNNFENDDKIKNDKGINNEKEIKNDDNKEKEKKIENKNGNENKNNKDIKITLFNIEENYNLINLLHLEYSEFDIREKTKIVDKNNSNKEKIKKNDINKKPEKSLINIDEINIDDTLLISPHRTIHNTTNSQSSTKLMKNIQNTYIKNNHINHITNLKEMPNKNESTNNISIRKSNYIITKKITGLNNININIHNTNNSAISNKMKDSIVSNNNKSQINKENKNTSNIKNIQIKDNYIKSLYNMNSEETLCSSYSRSPMNRRNDNIQSIKLDKFNSNNKKDKKIKVGLNNKMNNYLNKNKEKRNTSKISKRKNNLSTNKNNNILTKRSSKDKDKQKDNLNTLNISYHNSKKIKTNNSKLTLRNHRSKKSFSSLYSEKNIFDSNRSKLINCELKNGEKEETFIQLDICNHYNNEEITKTENNSNNFQNIFKKDIALTTNNNINTINNYNNTNTNNIFDNNNVNNTNNAFENKNKKDLQNIVLTQMKSLTPNFSRINMNEVGIQLVCSYLHKNPNKIYKEIKLLGCNLTDDDLFLLVKTLLDHNINLLILNLSNNNIGDESATSILDLVKEHRTLKGLSLYNNLISDILKEKLKEYTELGRENLHTIQLYI